MVLAVRIIQSSSASSDGSGRTQNVDCLSTLTMARGYYTWNRRARQGTPCTHIWAYLQVDGRHNSPTRASAWEPVKKSQPVGV